MTAGNVINLRKTRKAKARTQKEAKATENRAKFGQPKAARAAQEAETKLQQARLDGLLLDQSRTKTEDEQAP